MSDLDDQSEQVRGRGKAETGGASITFRDRRLTKLENWFWASLGLSFVAGSFTAASNLYDLNKSMARVLDNNAIVAEQLKDHELRLRQAERDISIWSGRNLRDGPPDPDKPIKPLGRR